MNVRNILLFTLLAMGLAGTATAQSQRERFVTTYDTVHALALPENGENPRIAFLNFKRPPDPNTHALMSFQVISKDGRTVDEVHLWWVEEGRIKFTRNGIKIGQEIIPTESHDKLFELARKFFKLQNSLTPSEENNREIDKISPEILALFKKPYPITWFEKR